VTAGRGFSLVEILVVMVVVVLLIGMVSLTLDSGARDGELQRLVERLEATASYALDEAQFSGSDFGLLLVRSQDSTGNPQLRGLWRQRLPDGWRRPLRSEQFFTPLVFPAGVEVSLVLEEQGVIPEDPEAADPRNGVAPQWWFSSAGETVTGSLLLTDADSGDPLWLLEWDLLGRMERYRGDEQEPLGDARTI
jgi:prepilin-type N-terminal cleavage/methylation domain-containing protein